MIYSRETSDLSHPLVADRVASGLVVASAGIDAAQQVGVRSTRRGSKQRRRFLCGALEQFIEEHARDAIALAELTGVAGVSARALQMGFRRFRDTTPMAYLRSIRLELARTELANKPDS